MNKYTKKYNVILDNMDLFNYELRPISAIMYLQDAFARYCATKKVAAYDLFPENMYWIVTEFNIEFIDKLPFWSEEIEIKIWVSELSKLKIYTDYEITHKDKPFAKGNALWFLVDTSTKRPVKTDIISERFEICPELVSGEHKKFTLPETTENYNEITHTINLSDLDFNKHVNNKSYINIAEMTAPVEFKKNNTVRQLSIKFNKETFLGDTLVCTAYRTNNAKTFVHKIEKDGVSVCDIATTWEGINERNTKCNIIDYNLDVKNEK